MFKKLKNWRTSTRNKILIPGLLFIGYCVVYVMQRIDFVLQQWASGKLDAAAVLTALITFLSVLTGGGGLWAAIVAASTGWEKGKRGEVKIENP